MQLVYDVAAGAPMSPWWLMAAVAPPAFATIVTLVAPWPEATTWPVRRKGVSRGQVFFFVAIYAVVGFGLAAAIGAHFIADYRLRAAERAGRLDVAEGCLSAFVPSHRGGKARSSERIMLAGHEFDYDGSGVGFGTVEELGGPIHPDTRVRLAFRDNDIARVEVEPHACPAAGPGRLG